MTKEQIKQELLNNPDAMERAQFIKLYSEATPEIQELVKRALGLNGEADQKAALEEINAILQTRKADKQ